MSYRIRINKIRIENLKNVKFGEIDLRESKDNKVSLLGLYGQNGSGKTTLIDSLDILKSYLSGFEIKQDYVNMINQKEKFARFSFDFEINDKDRNDNNAYFIKLSFCIKKIEEEKSDAQKNILNENMKVSNKVLEVFNENISFSYCDDKEKINSNTIIDTTDCKTFKPESKYNEIFGTNKEVKSKIFVEKLIANKTSKSYIFCANFLNIFNNTCKNEKYKYILKTLHEYGLRNLNVLYSASTDIVKDQVMIIFLDYSENSNRISGSMPINFTKAFTVPANIYKNVKNAFNQMNIVLNQIIPEMSIEFKDIAIEMSKDMVENKIVELISHRGDIVVPLRFESAGIRKIVSTLSLLISVYNNENVTVAIDELDSGIFEYLLGELLNIFSNDSKGQLIYTSHNLRALEIINKDFTAFTTTDENNRYIHFKGIKSNNNLRDYYFTDIVFGEQDVETYKKTNKYEIALALHNAGVIGNG